MFAMSLCWGIASTTPTRHTVHKVCCDSMTQTYVMGTMGALLSPDTGDAAAKQRLDYLVDELSKVQVALNERGYLSAFPSEHFDRVEALQGVWAPYYVVSWLRADEGGLGGLAVPADITAGLGLLGLRVLCRVAGSMLAFLVGACGLSFLRWPRV